MFLTLIIWGQPKGLTFKKSGVRARGSEGGGVSFGELPRLFWGFMVFSLPILLYYFRGLVRALCPPREKGLLPKSGSCSCSSSQKGPCRICRKSLLLHV